MKRKLKEINRNEVLNYLDYEPDEGQFRWKNNHGNAKAGDIAGGKATTGYMHIYLNGQIYRLHRLVWLVEKNENPIDDIDHIDRDKTNNRITNLRIATRQQNMINTDVYQNNSSGVKGVSFDKRERKWKSYIGVNYKTKFLGYSASFEEAVSIRRAAEKIYFDHKFSGGNDEENFPPAG